MNDQSRPSDLSLMKFGIGQPVQRKEDPILVRGEGRYTDDVRLPGQAYAAFVRSPYAHGGIQGIDVEAAGAMPGVLAVYTAADLAAAGLGPLQAVLEFKNRDGTPMTQPPRPALPSDRVRYVGEPVACVVAETPAQARDAAEAVALDIEVLPAVTDPRQAAAAGAPQLHDEPPERRARLPFRRRRQGRGRVRAGGARHAARAHQQPHRREPDGAARGGRRVRRGERPLHAARRQPGRVRHARRARRGDARRRQGEGARADAAMSAAPSA